MVNPDPIDVSVGLRVRTRRKSLKMSQTKLADRLGVTFQQIQKYEKGSNRISASTLVRIAQGLNCPVAALLGETDSESKNGMSQNLLAVPGAEDLLKAYATLNTQETRHAILTITQALVEETQSLRPRRSVSAALAA